MLPTLSQMTPSMPRPPTTPARERYSGKSNVLLSAGKLGFSDFLTTGVCDLPDGGTTSVTNLPSAVTLQPSLKSPMTIEGPYARITRPIPVLRNEPPGLDHSHPQYRGGLLAFDGLTRSLRGRSDLRGREALSLSLGRQAMMPSLPDSPARAVRCSAHD